MDKNAAIVISKLQLIIAGNKIELSLEQAKELKRILNEAFPDKEIQYVPTYIERTVNPTPVPFNPYPIWYGGLTNGENCGQVLCLSTSNNQLT